MNRDLVFRKPARREFDDAVLWYEREQAELGNEFREAVARTLSTIALQPDRFRRVHGEVRRAVMRHFPFAIHFLHDDDRIIVVAVFHCSRNPGSLRRR